MRGKCDVVVAVAGVVFAASTFTTAYGRPTNTYRDPHCDPNQNVLFGPAVMAVIGDGTAT